MSHLPPVPATVVFGADGFIGGNLLRGLQTANPACIGVGRRPGASRMFLDLAAPDIEPLTLRAHGITHAVIAADISRIAVCEREPARTWAINVTGTAELARQLLRQGIRVVALSSDYVFDGCSGSYDDRSPVRPLNEYGRQKVAMEEALRAHGCGETLIVRLSKVFDLQPGSGTLLDEMAGRLLAGAPVRAAYDQFFCPTLIDDLTEGMLRVVASGRTGIVHLCAPTRMSRWQLAVNVAAAFGSSPALIEKISLRDLPESFPRPLDTSMIATQIDGMPPAHFTRIDDCIARLRTAYGRSMGGGP